MNLRDISVVVTSSNEDRNVARCLDRLSAFGEVVLVDSFSTDRTLHIARTFPVTTFLRPCRSTAEQRNWGLDRVKKPWVLVLGACETPPEKLLTELESLDENAAAGYWIERETDYIGRRVRWCGWGSDKVLRLFRRDAGRYEGTETQERLVFNGTASHLVEKLGYSPYPSAEDHFRAIEERSGGEARAYVQRGGRAPLFKMLVRPPLRFLEMFFVRLGILDGSSGFILCLLTSYGEFLKYAKAWELLHSREPLK